MVLKSCLYCKNEFYVKPHREDIAKYCSRRCKGLNERMSVSCPCAFCGEIFEHISSRVNKAKYCSKKCYNKSQIGKGLTTYQCQHCKKRFHDSASRNRKYCSKACVNKTAKEKWHPKFTTVRKKMLATGMMVSCDLCDYNEVPEILGVHHIDGDRLNNAKENLQVLCPMCHSLTHRKHISH